MCAAVSCGGEARFNRPHPKTHNRIKIVAIDPDLGPWIALRKKAS
jgi:DNA end-binding protein Ku